MLDADVSQGPLYDVRSGAERDVEAPGCLEDGRFIADADALVHILPLSRE